MEGVGCGGKAHLKHACLDEHEQDKRNEAQDHQFFVNFPEDDQIVRLMPQIVLEEVQGQFEADRKNNKPK